MRDKPKSNREIFTVGHSTRSFDDFVAMLHAHEVKAIADVRRFPRSRRLPHFNDDELRVALPRAGIEYLPYLSLGGRRRASPDSINLGWRNEGFRGYADFLQTDDFANALASLERDAAKSVTAIMCAEAVPWRCHRSLIADALLVRGWEVLDITSESRATPHKLTSFAVVEGTTITYPKPEDVGEPGLFDRAD